jgi:hypothetical protein
MKVFLNGINAMDWLYHQDGNWHHYAFVWNAQTGLKNIYVDGVLNSGFSTIVPNLGTISGTTGPVYLNNTTTSYQIFYGDLDEVALYSNALSPLQIYKNYTDAVAGQHYTTALAGSVPAALPTTASTDVNDYPIGYVAGSGNASGVTSNALRQFMNAPLPRFKPNHTLPRNFNWMQLQYLGNEDFYTGIQLRDTSTVMNYELAKKWNYQILVADNLQAISQYFSTPTHYSYKWIELANSYPSIECGAITLWNQLFGDVCGGPSDSSYVSRKGLSANHYLRNNLGQFINNNGTVVTAGTSKIFSPAAPLDSIYKDGDAMLCDVNILLARLTRPLNYISENDEVLTNWNVSAVSLDPAAVAQKGALAWDEYLSLRKYSIDNAFKSRFTPTIQADATAGGQTFAFSEYTITGNDADGSTNDTLRYKWIRLIQDPVNGRRLSTYDYYVNKPEWWYDAPGAYHGWGDVIEHIRGTIANQDSFMAPFSNASWKTNPEEGVRATQYLGNLKLLSSVGAIRYHAAYFNLGPPIVSPRGYAYQAMTPSYAQACFTRVPYENSTLLTGDWNINVTSLGTLPGYQYYAGNKHKVVTVRQNKANSNEYIITTALQKLSNTAGLNSAADGYTASFTLAGQSLTVKARNQGCVYLWNKTDSTLVWIDEWHQEGDPSRWTGDFYLQAELYDEGSFPIKTYGNSVYDYTNAFTVVSYADTATVFDTLKYAIEPRDNKTYYVWIRARSKDGTSGNVIFQANNGTRDTTDAITETNWFYYRYKLTGSDTIKVTLTGDTISTIKLRVTNKKIEIDQVVLTTDANLTFPESTVICGLTANVTASGAVTFCSGGSVTLTATAATSYIWSTGATTRAINATTSGNYSVTIYDGSGCSGSSSATAVTVNALPGTPGITLLSGSICYGDSLRLQATGTFSSYVWSTGATTQTIYVSADGQYRVTVTNVNGCTNGNDTTVDFNALLNPGITLLTPIGVCEGDSVQLQLNSAYLYSDYAWFNYPDTTNEISTDSILDLEFFVDDSVKVWVEDADGCVASSSTLVVIRVTNCNTCESVQNLRVATITARRAVIRWAELTQAESFVVYVTDMSTSLTKTNTIESGEARTSTFTGLKPGRTYNYYVEVTCRNGETKRSVTKRFTTNRN